MAGPRIEPYWVDAGFVSDPEPELRYRALCCLGYYGGSYMTEYRAQEKLAIHLQDEHGIVKEPSSLQVDRVPDTEERDDGERTGGFLG